MAATFQRHSRGRLLLNVVTGGGSHEQRAPAAPTDLDHLDVQRTLHRVTLIGDRPVGPDGFVSEIVAGREFRAEALVVA
jgi:uncharacterized protein YciI